MWFSTARGPNVPFYSDLMSTLTTQQPDTYSLAICTDGPPTCDIGIDSYIGSGSAELAYLNYNTRLSANTLYNIVESISDNGASMYLNGINVSFDAYSGVPSLLGTTTPYDYVSIGAGISPFTPYIGQIEDVRVYNSVLTPAQARQIYEQGAAPQYSAALSGG